MLTNREVATAIIIGLIVLSIALMPETRRSIPTFLGVLGSAKLLLMFFVYFTYALILIILAARTGAWTTEMLKDTVLVALVTGLPILMESDNMKSGANIVRKVAREAVGISVFLAAYVNLASFSIPVEVVVQLLVSDPFPHGSGHPLSRS